jgi:hypothetical protein
MRYHENEGIEEDTINVTYKLLTLQGPQTLIGVEVANVKSAVFETLLANIFSHGGRKRGRFES